MFQEVRPSASAAPAGSATSALTPTPHPPVPRNLSRLWLAPAASDRAAAAADPALGHLQTGLELYAQSRYEQALAHFVQAAAPRSPLREYGVYYAGVCELRLQRFEPARKRFVELKNVDGYLTQAAVLGEAEALQGLGNYGAEAKAYQRLLDVKPLDEPAIWLSLATARMAAGDRAKAAEAYLHLYYEFPTNELAGEAAGPLSSMTEVQPIDSGNTRYKLELGRAERLFGMRRIAESRSSFLRVQPYASGDDRERIALRLAECDYHQGRYLQAREALRPYLDQGARQAEARFFYLMSQMGLGNKESFERLARALMDDFPDSSWAEDALNNLVTYYLKEKTDEEIDGIVREQYKRYPIGRYSERAAWKAGWFAYRAGNMREAAGFFETAAASFPRSDYRPAYLYWAGRARAAMNDRLAAAERFQLEATDYLHTYYGPLALAELEKLGAQPLAAALVFVDARTDRDDEGGELPPSADTIRTLLALGLYDPAVKELDFARQRWGDSPALQATMAWVNRQKAESETGAAQFALARGAITLMKRAYPQFLAAGGEELPRELLTVIYPLKYWDLIRKYSVQRGLDPYLIAALMAQESTFVADVRSAANAYGLTQLRPATARHYARTLRLRYSKALLTSPEANINIGTAYFADKVRQFGSVDLALASYNAGEQPVYRWRADNPSLSPEEFIDNIPYPETQGYVRRILGTAEEYRRLYGPR